MHTMTNNKHMITKCCLKSFKSYNNIMNKMDKVLNQFEQGPWNNEITHFVHVELILYPCNNNYNFYLGTLLNSREKNDT